MDGLQHEVEHHGVQQREGHPGAAHQPLEAGHPHVQQVSHKRKRVTRGTGQTDLYFSASEAFDSTYPTNVVVTSEGTCTYIPPGKQKTFSLSLTRRVFQAFLCQAVRWTSLGSRSMIRIVR